MADTLKSICDQCRQLNNPQLDFIPNELARNREVILRDLGELVSAANQELEKSVAILAGCILEGVLFSFLKAQEGYIAERRGAFTFNPDHGLQNYLNIFNRWFRGIFRDLNLPDTLVSYRDLIHINRELNEGVDICSRASREMLRTLDVLLEELSHF